MRTPYQLISFAQILIVECAAWKQSILTFEAISKFSEMWRQSIYYLGLSVSLMSPRQISMEALLRDHISKCFIHRLQRIKYVRNNTILTHTYNIHMYIYTQINVLSYLLVLFDRCFTLSSALSDKWRYLNVISRICSMKGSQTTAKSPIKYNKQYYKP